MLHRYLKDQYNLVKDYVKDPYTIALLKERENLKNSVNSEADKKKPSDKLNTPPLQKLRISENCKPPKNSKDHNNAYNTNSNANARKARKETDKTYSGKVSPASKQIENTRVTRSKSGAGVKPANGTSKVPAAAGFLPYLHGDSYDTKNQDATVYAIPDSRTLQSGIFRRGVCSKRIKIPQGVPSKILIPELHLVSNEIDDAIEGESSKPDEKSTKCATENNERTLEQLDIDERKEESMETEEKDFAPMETNNLVKIPSVCEDEDDDDFFAKLDAEYEDQKFFGNEYEGDFNVVRQRINFKKEKTELSSSPLESRALPTSSRISLKPYSKPYRWI